MGENYTTFTGETISDFFAEQRGLFGFRGSFEDGGGFFPVGIIRLIHLFCAEQHGDGGVCERTGLRVVRALFWISVEAVKEMVVLSPDRRRGPTKWETMKRPGFTSGAIDTKNMLGRYLYTSIAPDGTSWMINNSARIVSGDHIKVNGVVHIVDKALAGNTDLLADYIETEGHFKLYGEALHATGLR